MPVQNNTQKVWKISVPAKSLLNWLPRPRHHTSKSTKGNEKKMKGTTCKNDQDSTQENDHFLGIKSAELVFEKDRKIVSTCLAIYPKSYRNSQIGNSYQTFHPQVGIKTATPTHILHVLLEVYTRMYVNWIKQGRAAEGNWHSVTTKTIRKASRSQLSILKSATLIRLFHMPTSSSQYGLASSTTTAKWQPLALSCPWLYWYIKPDFLKWSSIRPTWMSCVRTESAEPWLQSSKMSPHPAATSRTVWSRYLPVLISTKNTNVSVKAIGGGDWIISRDSFG